jgi:DNA-binding transcriptional regulator YiaG
MAGIQSALGQWVRKLARRELKPLIGEAKKRAAEHRRSIAALKRQMKAMQRELQVLRKHAPAEPQVPQEAISKARLRIDGLKTHRAKLGLSAKEYGKLMGVSALTIYKWEAGKSKPRRSQLPRIVAVRGIGKREAMRRLGGTN